LADPLFDRAAFESRLRTRLLGRPLIARAEVESTNDVAWEALAAGMPHGTTVVADAQTRGRGRAGRAWRTAPGRGLALSVLLGAGCGPHGALPLAAGLALARALDGLGARAELKWPNDLLLGGRKVAGILSEGRRSTPESERTDAFVVGAGVNVLEEPADLAALAGEATSLAIEGLTASREEVAAGFLNALEPLWSEIEEGSPGAVIAAWRERASFWGRTVRVRTPAGEVTGVARGLDPRGALVVERAGGGEIAVLAGDLELSGEGDGRE
jgi:BirA family biotin operon repressor/biotin-[acetyl-CoA-carboxylase] ligase